MNNSGTIDSDSVEIATAASQAFMSRPEKVGPFLQLMIDKKPSAETVARAVVVAATTYGGTPYEHIKPMLDAYLQLVLTREHVAAQEKMSRAAGYLAAASVFIAIVALFGGFIR